MMQPRPSKGKGEEFWLLKLMEKRGNEKKKKKKRAWDLSVSMEVE